MYEDAYENNDAIYNAAQISPRPTPSPSDINKHLVHIEKHSEYSKWSDIVRRQNMIQAVNDEYLYDDDGMSYISNESDHITWNQANIYYQPTVYPRKHKMVKSYSLHSSPKQTPIPQPRLSASTFSALSKKQKQKSYPFPQQQQKQQLNPQRQFGHAVPEIRSVRSIKMLKNRASDVYQYGLENARSVPVPTKAPEKQPALDMYSYSAL